MLQWLSLFLVSSVLLRSYATDLCGEDLFPCNDGTCIEKLKWCDGTEDCPDDSDEHYCFKRSLIFSNPNRCNDNFFLCRDGPCIPLKGRCDGFPSCHDNSDEADCATTVTTSSFSPVITSVVDEQTHRTDGTTTSSGRQSSTYAITVEEVATGFEVDTEMIFANASSTETAVQRNWTFSTTDESRPLSTLQDAEVAGKPLVQNEMIPDVPQADSIAKPTQVHLKEQNITRGFKKLDIRTMMQQKDFAQRWLLTVRDQDYGWGEETARALTALYMSDYFSKKETEEKMLMSKQLHLKISMALIRNQTKKMALSELSLYVNALLASCDNPRNFYGNDLIDILRIRTNAAQVSAEFVSPSVYLTLCLSNMTTFADVKNIQETFVSNRPAVDRIGIQALATLAAACTSGIPEFSNTHLGLRLAKKLYEKVKHGFPENIYELALMVQALNEAKINQDLWSRSDALNLISQWKQLDGSVSDILATYYILPIFSGKSLISISSHCYPEKEMGLTAVDVLMNSKDDKLPVIYSLYFGEPLSLSQSLRTRVSKSATLLDLMRIAARENHVYRFKFDMAHGRPSVYSIGGIANDAEQGLYWVLHVLQHNATGGSSEQNLVPFDGDIRSYTLNAADNIVFWLKKLH